MQAQKFFGLAKEAHSLIAFCEESLLLIGRHIAARTHFEAGAGSPRQSANEGETLQARMHRETAVQARAFAEKVRDPEIKRLLGALAERYDQMAVPGRRHRRPTIAFGK
jgi:hypothetical protein